MIKMLHVICMDICSNSRIFIFSFKKIEIVITRVLDNKMYNIIYFYIYYLQYINKNLIDMHVRYKR
jgi:hypothetical protein